MIIEFEFVYQIYKIIIFRLYSNEIKRKMIYIGIILMIIPHTLSNVLIADYTMSRMIELTSKSPYCILHSDR